MRPVKGSGGGRLLLGEVARRRHPPGCGLTAPGGFVNSRVPPYGRPRLSSAFRGEEIQGVDTA